MSTTTTEAAVNPDVQDLARQLLRRLMAERNLRTADASRLLNVETHTLRRMLNGSRAIALDEIVIIANYGGYSLDEQFGLHAHKNGSNGGNRNASVNEGLGRVFSAIAELLSSAPAGAHNLETRESLMAQRRNEPAPREMTGQLSAKAQEALARIVAGENGQRRRGRPRKVA